MDPKAPFTGSVVGPRKTGVFSTLKQSARKRMRNRSLMAKVLFTDKSRRRCASNRTLENRYGNVRILLARAWVLLRLKMLVLNQRSTLRWSDGSTRVVESPV